MISRFGRTHHKSADLMTPKPARCLSFGGHEALEAREAPTGSRKMDQQRAHDRKSGSRPLRYAGLRTMVRPVFRRTVRRRRRIGASPSGKAADFDSAIRRFESSAPAKNPRFERKPLIFSEVQWLGWGSSCAIVPPLSHPPAEWVRARTSTDAAASIRPCRPPPAPESALVPPPARPPPRHRA